MTLPDTGLCVHLGVFSQKAAASDPQPCGVEDYPSAVARLLSFPAPHFVVFTADKDAKTGQPWCPDCARALPGVLRQVTEAGGTLLEVEVRQSMQHSSQLAVEQPSLASRLTSLRLIVYDQNLAFRTCMCEKAVLSDQA